MTVEGSPLAAPLDALPGPVARHLLACRDTLVRELGSTLTALVVHGSAARGTYTAGTSNLDVIVVLRAADPATLLAISNPLQVARSAARIEAMILVEDEIARAADAFPLLYVDVQRHHVLLAGRDPFAGLNVPFAHRRFRVEQELREVQIRMRRLVVDGIGNRPLLLSALARKTKQLRPALRALLRCGGLSRTATTSKRCSRRRASASGSMSRRSWTEPGTSTVR